MEDNKIIYENENKRNIEEKDISLIDSLIKGIDILPILKKSISYQKKFISTIIEQLQKSIDKKLDNNNNKKISKQIFTFLKENSKALGISFFYLLIKEEEFSKKIIFGFFYDNIFKQEIIDIIHQIIEIFNFDFENNENPIENYYKDLIDCGIIEQKDLIKHKKRFSLTQEEQLYEGIESIFLDLKRYRELGNNIEKDASEFFNSRILSCETDLNLFPELNNISNATIEFYQEKIEEVKNYMNKNENFEEIEKENNILNNNENNINKYNDKDKYRDFYDFNNKNENDKTEENINEDYEEEEEGEEEINIRDKIIKDVKELRKKPLKERIYFYKDEQLIEGENEFIEFKNYYFPLQYFQKEELSRQICSFLNSNGGRLYIGINSKKIVKGVVSNDKDNYKNIIFNLVKNFYPKIKGNDYLKFYAIPIINNQNGTIIPNLFVLKIIIKKGDPSILYSFSNNGLKSSIRLFDQCANLTAEEIHKEIIERNILKFSLHKRSKSTEFIMYSV